jgi:hypothetical protein
MTQNREPPAFQEYAAPMLARFEFRTLSWPARGLLYTLRLECWVNGRLPAKPAVLAGALGFPLEQFEAALAEVKPFFRIDGEWLYCPELADYRAHLDERRQRQSQGGRKGAEITNGTSPSVHKRASTATPPGSPPGVPRGARRVLADQSRASRGSLVKQSPVQSSKDQFNTSSEEGSELDEWVREYDSANPRS